MHKEFIYNKELDYVKEIVKAYSKLLEFKKLEILSNIKNKKKIHNSIILKRLHKIKNERTKFLLKVSRKTKENNLINIEQKKLSVVNLTKKSSNSYFFNAETSNVKMKSIPRLVQKLIHQDPWFKQINRLPLSKSIKSIAINSWREIQDCKIILHIRKSHFHFTSELIKNFLQKVIRNDVKKLIELSMVEDNDTRKKTPSELYHILYEKELMQVKKTMRKDENILILETLFKIKINESNIFLI